jgi:hypothetical protein
VSGAAPLLLVALLAALFPGAVGCRRAAGCTRVAARGGPDPTAAGAGRTVLFEAFALSDPPDGAAELRAASASLCGPPVPPVGSYHLQRWLLRASPSVLRLAAAADGGAPLADPPAEDLLLEESWERTECGERSAWTRLRDGRPAERGEGERPAPGAPARCRR